MNTTLGLTILAEIFRANRESPRAVLPVVIFNTKNASSDMHRISTAVGTVIVCYSEECAYQAELGVWWHDDAEHCRTWTDQSGCSCDVEGVDCTPARAPAMAPPAGVVVLDLQITRDGIRMKGPPRVATEAEAEQLVRNPPAPGGPPVVLSAPTLRQVEPAADGHDPKTCPTCISNAAAHVFGGPGEVKA